MHTSNSSIGQNLCNPRKNHWLHEIIMMILDSQTPIEVDLAVSFSQQTDEYK